MDTQTPEITVIIQGPPSKAKTILMDYLRCFLLTDDPEADRQMNVADLGDRLRGHVKDGLRIRLAEQTVLTELDMTPAIRAALAEANGEDPALTKKKALPVDTLPLTVRTRNCLYAENIRTVGELIKLTEHQLLKTPNLGRKGIMEIVEVLTPMDLRLANR